MTKEVENEATGQEARIGACLLWFVWGISLSFMAIFSLVLLALLALSVALNLYLGWEMSGLEVSVSRPGTGPAVVDQAPLPLIPTDVLASIPTNTPEPTPPTNTPTPMPTESPLEIQVATLSALATEVAALQQSTNTSVPVLTATPVPPPTALSAADVSPTPVPTAVAIGTPAAETEPSEVVSEDSTESTSAEAPAVSSTNSVAVEGGEAHEFSPPATSSNTYSLIPIEGERDKRPGEEHGDLNLKLRDPQPIDVDPSLVDIPNAGIDPHAPNLADVFQPNFSSAYTVHNWDWACNCKGDLIKEDQVVLVGIDTTPGEPIFIPTKDQDIFGGQFYAMLLYASEDSVTFAYTRDGTVAHGYAVHYLGLHTDPNLLALYRESKGKNELPGLALDTPVGVASDELIVAIRDKGAFKDARSKKDWWD